MTTIADRFLVVLDANVLYPFRKRDVLLHFYAAGLFRARWTERILQEWSSNLLQQKPELFQSIQQQQAKMKEAFPEALVSGFELLEPELRLPDPKDCHVLAAAIRCGAQHIVTDNTKDFPSEVLDEYDIDAVDADEFLYRTFELYPERAVLVLREVRRKYKNPPYSPAEFVLDLTAKGMPKLAQHAKHYRELL